MLLLPQKQILVEIQQTLRVIGCMAPKGQKLSKPQVELLRELPRGVWDGYQPIKKLIALGLASMIEGSGRFGHPYYVRTQAGEDWIAANPPESSTP